MNEYGWSALMLAANNNQMQVVGFLLDNGANPNTQNDVGETALYMAAKLNLVIIVDILLKFGAKPRLKTSDKSTAMIAAAINGSKKISNLLLHADHGAIHDRDINGWYPLHFASKCGNERLVEFLLSRKGIQVDCRTKFGQSPLHLACRFSGNKEVVKLLLHKEANIEAKDYGDMGFKHLYYLHVKVDFQ